MSSSSERPQRVHPVVVFDLDGTLLRGTTVSLLLAPWLGRTAELTELERAFQANEISNKLAADMCAGWFTGRSVADALRLLSDGPWIAGMAETLELLRAAGSRLLLATLTWRFAADMLGARYGFLAVSGTEMPVRGGLLSGSVSRHFDEHDKAHFVEEWCEQNGHSMRDVAAVGDSRSDVPLFRRVGTSIALNATADARAAATHVLETEDLRDVLSLLLPGRPPGPDGAPSS
jgi:phosphoserine phosphatase